VKYRARLVRSGYTGLPAVGITCYLSVHVAYVRNALWAFPGSTQSLSGKGAYHLSRWEAGAAVAPLYDNVVLKVSGESLGSDRMLEPKRFFAAAHMIADVHSMGVAVTVVLGGGNIFRGTQAGEWGLPLGQADLAGMAATGINALLLEGLIKNLGLRTAVFSRGPAIGIGNSYTPTDVRAALQGGAVVLLAGGLGISGISTDVTAVNAAIDTASPAIIVSKYGIDGVYTSDPRDPCHGAEAIYIPILAATEALEQKLGVLDAAAFSLARDHGKLIHIVPATEIYAPRYVLEGKEIGSRVLPE
jgi:uridylate kinase